MRIRIQTRSYNYRCIAGNVNCSSTDGYACSRARAYNSAYARSRSHAYAPMRAARALNPALTSSCASSSSSPSSTFVVARHPHHPSPTSPPSCCILSTDVDGDDIDTHTGAVTVTVRMTDAGAHADQSLSTAHTNKMGYATTSAFNETYAGTKLGGWP